MASDAQYDSHLVAKVPHWEAPRSPRDTDPLLYPSINIQQVHEKIQLIILFGAVLKIQRNTENTMMY